MDCFVLPADGGGLATTEGVEFVIRRNNPLTHKHMRESIQCHDCGKAIKKGAKFAEYEAAGATMYKCAACYKQDAVLRNFRSTEVYSRVVGYIRPVSQWNKGKQAEYADRKEYCAC